MLIFQGIEIISQHFPHLYSLGLAELNLTDQDVETLSKGRFQLDTLNLTECQNITGTQTGIFFICEGKCLAMILNGFPNLVRLYTAKCGGIYVYRDSWTGIVFWDYFD